MMNVIEIKNLNKKFKIPHEKKTTLFENLIGLMKIKLTYEVLYALKDVNLTVEQGEALGIIGVNGSGKSTLLKIIAGIIEPTTGTVMVTGKVSPFLELGVGFQDNLTAKENIRLYGAIMGLSKKEIDESFDRIIRFAELEKFVDTEIVNYSDGMRVRLAFSTAIETKGDIFLMDEVFAVGDTRFQKKYLDTLVRFKKEEKTIILVSHDMDIVDKICDRVMLLDEGVIKSMGEPKKTIESYYALLNRKNEENPLSARR